ncbi:MAG: archaemetzincin [Planctomycetota bacterium]|jgi:archaemetzincin
MRANRCLILPGILVAGFALRGSPAGTPTARRPAGKPSRAESVKMLEQAMVKLRPLHRKLGRAAPGEWLYHHKEPGQTFRQYIGSGPAKRRVIYIQPLGTFSGPQRRIIDVTAEFMGAWFKLPVKVRQPLDLSIIPARAQRKHPTRGDHQILTGYVLERVLRPRLPKDAFAMIAFTTSDLWPGEGWNFVFGEASLRRRVGVWSLYRFGDPARSGAAYRRCLLRTTRCAVHEMGHMFSMLHCTAYACGMCGSNSLDPGRPRGPIPQAGCPLPETRADRPGEAVREVHQGAQRANHRPGGGVVHRLHRLQSTNCTNYTKRNRNGGELDSWEPRRDVAEPLRNL